MKIETQPRDDHQLTLVVELDTATQTEYMRRAARKISQQVRIPGFRPGKAPYDVVKRNVGDQSIEQQAIEIMLDEIYPKALKEANIEPSGPGSLHEQPTLNPPKFQFLVPLKPEVIVGDYQSIRQEFSPKVVTEEDINHVLRRLQINHAVAEPVEDRPAQENDMVYISLKGQLTHPEEGQDVEVIKEQPMQFVISPIDDTEENSFPYPGFYKELNGLAVNEVKTIFYTYPDDSEYDRLKGKEVEFQFTIQSIKSLQLPELNDDFAHSIGENLASLDALKEEIRKQSEQSQLSQYESDYFNELTDKIIALSSVKYPPHMLEEEIKEVKKSFETNLSRRRMDLATYLKTIKKEESEFVEEELKPSAQKQLIRSLILQEIMKIENVQVSQEELQAAVGSTIQEMGRMPGFDNLPRGTKVNDLVQYATLETANRLLNKRLLERLKTIATGKLNNNTTDETTNELPVGTEAVAEETIEPTEVTAVSEVVPAQPVEEVPQSETLETENNIPQEE